ncbi:MAG: protein kinase [Verrucomicrobiales bacterium]|nr:protein kinase [Verrucomicrobiales bacterium]
MNLATETAFTSADAVAAQPPLTPAELAPHFSQLEILECLGRGGMGVVYKARQKSLNRGVALKLLAPERVTDVKFAERFTREAQALAQLNHPHIVTIHDFGQAGGFYFLLMEFVDGVNLRQLLRSRKLTPEEALAIVPPLCDALQYAHDHGIVHRDIKPENLLLDREGRVKIADFGIAKMLGAEPAATGITDTQPVGTPQYMAPEQKTAPHTADNRADLYSLGVVFYEMLTGELPGAKLQPPSRKVQVDVRLDEIVLRALEKSPELRFATATQFRAEVEAVAANRSVAGRETVAAANRTSRFTLARVAVVGGVAAFLILLLFVGAFFVAFLTYYQARRAAVAERAAVARAAAIKEQQEASQRNEGSVLAGLITFPTNQAAGIGVAFTQRDGHIIVGKVLPNAPAARDGRLKAGDRVMCVEEEGQEYVQLDGMTLAEALKLIRGKEGGPITLHVVPQGKTIEERIQIKLTREQLPLSEAEESPLRDRLAQYERAFAAQTAAGANQAVAFTRTFSLRHMLASDMVDQLPQILRGHPGHEAKPSADNQEVLVAAPPDVMTRVQTFITATDWPDKIDRGSNYEYPRQTVMRTARSFFYACAIEDAHEVFSKLFSLQVLAELKGEAKTREYEDYRMGGVPDAQWEASLRGDWPGKEEAVQRLVREWNRYPLKRITEDSGVAIGFGVKHFCSVSFDGAPKEFYQVTIEPGRTERGTSQNSFFFGSLPPWWKDSKRASVESPSYQQFDQTPGQGWRALAEQRRFVEAAQMIENYLTNQTNLAMPARANLHFHAAQCLAFTGDAKTVLDALGHLKKARHSDWSPDDPVKWNDYVAATEAFLKGDLAALKTARQQIAAGPKLNGKPANLDMVDRLIANFGKPYVEVYGTDATAPTRLEF